MKIIQFKILSILILTISISLGLVNLCFAEQGEPKIYYVDSENTIYVERTQTQTETIVDLRDVAAAIKNEDILKEETSKVWLLKADIFIKNGVKLFLTDETVSWLKLESNPNYFVWLKTYNGDILIQNTKITSWNSEEGTFDTTYEDGRSFILAKYNSKMDIINSELAYLGYSGGEAYGVSWRIAEGTLGQYFVTGEVRGSSFHHNYYGAYSFGAQEMIFK